MERKVSDGKEGAILMKSLLATVAFAGLAWCACVTAGEVASKPRKLDVLGQYAGHWTSEVLSRPAVWDRKGSTFHAESDAETVLDGWFLQQLEMQHVDGDPEKVTKALHLWTWDPGQEKYL